MRRVLLGLGALTALVVASDARVPVQPAPEAPQARQVWQPACHGLRPGDLVRSARPLKQGSGSARRQFWRGHWRVTQVLEGGRFLAEPLFRKDDTTGEILRGPFAPFPGETARLPPGALRCEAFVGG
ncbi:MAG: hypothetical protein ACK4S2_10460 [Gemmobacter sp.]|uniref:hypothetical protein n=1 Tax=Gemmobacter sp. TaxID=1898957 RepID=UPI003919DCF6